MMESAILRINLELNDLQLFIVIKSIIENKIVKKDKII
jgi:hypothetical protein